MSSNQPIDLLSPDIGAMIQPSVASVQTTFGAMERTVEVITQDCTTVSETLESLGDALNLVSQSGGSAQEWGSFGMLSLPILGAIKALKSVAGQYVKQHTGVPLSTWTDLVAGSQSQFRDYLAQLSTVAALAGRHADAAAGSALDEEQLEEDELALRQLRWQTQIWKQILGRVAQLGTVVDAILKAGLSAEATDLDVGDQHDQLSDLPVDRSDKATERANRFGQTLRKQIRDVQNRTVERSGDMRDLVLQPFVDVSDRVRQLPAQAQTLAREVALLELLLDLEIAQLRACGGKASTREAQAVGMRVAASVLLPELARSVTRERGRRDELESYLTRLTNAHAQGQVAERPYTILSDEYRNELRRSEARLEDLDAQVQAWRRSGPEVLHACIDITDLELAVVEARRLVGQPEEDDDHRAVLLRERQRLDEAGVLLARL